MAGAEAAARASSGLPNMSTGILSSMVTFRQPSTMNMRMQYFPDGLRSGQRHAFTRWPGRWRGEERERGVSVAAPLARLAVGALGPDKLPQQVAFLHLRSAEACVFGWDRGCAAGRESREEVGLGGPREQLTSVPRRRRKMVRSHSKFT